MTDVQVEQKSAEHCELMLYKAMLLVEGGQLEEALQFLEENACLVNDKLTYYEIRGALTINVFRTHAINVYSKDSRAAGTQGRRVLCVQTPYAV